MKKSYQLMSMMLAGVCAVSMCGCGSKTASVALEATDQTSQTSQTETQSQHEHIERKIDEIDKIIDKYYLNEDEIDPEAMEEGIMKGYVSGLGEKYTTYFTPDEFKSMLEDTEGTYEGIGMIVSQDIHAKIITVLTVFEGSPAEASGLQPGDIIFSVEGEEVGETDVNLVVAKIKGPAGTTVKLQVYRPSIQDYVDLEFERQKIDVPTTSHEMLEDQIGYIYIASFDGVTANQVNAAVEDLQNQGMKGLIIDLRDNPGGLVASAARILDRIFPKDKLLVYTIDKNDKKEELYSMDDDELDLPITILVNDNSASASEILTGAMKDYERATIVGTQTFGKGIVQAVIPLSDGSAMRVTTSRYYTPNGVCIHGVGIEPDVIVEDDPETPEDEQLQAAIDTLK